MMKDSVTFAFVDMGEDADNVGAARADVSHRIRYRAVWCTKWCRDLLADDDALQVRLFQLVHEAAGEVGASIETMDVAPSHVSVLMQVDPKTSPHQAVRRIKARTSRALREEFPALRSRVPTLWTNSYIVVSIGEDLTARDLDAWLETQSDR